MEASSTTTMTIPNWDDYKEVRITQKYIRSAVADEIDFLFDAYNKLPAFVRWLAGEEIKRNIIRLQTMVVIARQRKAL